MNPNEQIKQLLANLRDYQEDYPGRKKQTDMARLYEQAITDIYGCINQTEDFLRLPKAIKQRVEDSLGKGSSKGWSKLQNQDVQLYETWKMLTVRDMQGILRDVTVEVPNYQPKKFYIEKCQQVHQRIQLYLTENR